MMYYSRSEVDIAKIQKRRLVGKFSVVFLQMRLPYLWGYTIFRLTFTKLFVH